MSTVNSDSVAQDQLRAFIERIERMEEEKASIAADIKEIYAEAKGNGFDTKVIREIVRIRKQDASERAEHEAILELYLSALGMTTPIEAAARGLRDAQAPSQAVQRAAEQFVETAQKLGGVTIKTDGKVIEIGKSGKKPKPTNAVGFELGEGV